MYHSCWIIILFLIYNIYAFEERTVVIGPRSIDGNGMDEANLETPQWVLDLEEPVAMNSFFVKILDLDGNELSQSDAYLHHLLITGNDIRNIPCPEYGGWSFVAGSGAELTTIDIPSPYAYKINPGDEWEIALHVVNPSQHHSIDYKIEYTMNIGNWTEDLIEVEGYLNSAAGCGNDLSFDVPKNKSASSFIIHNDFLSTFSGEFVWMGAHLHRGGKNGYFSRSSTGEVVFSANCHYDDLKHSAYLTSIDSSTNIVQFERDEALRITVVYDCSVKYSDVMGIIFGYVKVNSLYSGDPPMEQIIGYSNPFNNVNIILPESSPDSSYEQSGSVNEISSEASNSGSSQENTNNSQEQDKAVLGLVASTGLILMFAVAVVLLIAVVVLFRIKSKRALEIFD